MPSEEQAAALAEYNDWQDMHATFCHLPKAGALDQFLAFWLLADEIYEFDPEEIREAERRLLAFKQRVNVKVKARGQPLPFPECDPT